MASQDGVSDDWEVIDSDTFSEVSEPSRPSSPITQITIPVQPALPSKTSHTNIATSTSTAASSKETGTNKDVRADGSVDVKGNIDLNKDFGTNEDMENEANYVNGLKEKELSENPAQGKETALKDPPISEFFDDPSADLPESPRAVEGSTGFVRLTLDTHHNPDSFLNGLTSLRNILDDTKHAYEDIPYAPLASLPISNRSPSIYDLLNFLGRQVAELMIIMSGYAKTPSPSSRNKQFDPKIHSWLSGMPMILLHLQEELQSEGPSRESTLHRCWTELSAFEKQMDDMLPLIQVDYSEFRNTQHRSSIDTVTNDPVGINFNSSLLFQELVHLKDELQRIMKLLSISASALPASAASRASDVCSSYTTLFNCITQVMGRSDSVWHDRSVATGLTHGNFVQIDTDSISDFVVALHLIWSDINVVSAGGTRTWSPETVKDHYNQMLLRQGQLDQLQTLVEVLTATLSPTWTKR